MSDIWFVSDTHFGHKNIIKYCGRPYADTGEMDAALLDNWNKVVKPEDTVWHLGDVAFHNHEIIGQLNGFINLVPGNHDHERRKKVEPFVDKWHDEVVYLEIDSKRKFTLCHYPFESWRREYPFHLHGHSHGTAGVHRVRLDVGVDATKLMRPMHIDEVMQNIMVNNLWAGEMQK